MNLLNVMEQVGSRQTKRIAQYVNDCLKEIAEEIPDKMERANISVVAETRLYSLPTNMRKLEGVYQRLDNDDDKYIRISRIQSVDVIQDSTTSTVSNDDDIIIV